MDKLSAMTVFRRVVELEAFAAAARDLRISSASVSKQVSRLEEGLGVRLLNRTTRRLSLTEAGQAYYERCARILDDVAEAESEVSSAAASPRGRLRVSAPMSFGIRHIGPILPAFLSRYPDITVDLALSDRTVDLLEEGVDVALRIADLADSSLIARRIGSIRRLAAASPAYLARRGEPSAPEDLVRHDCLIYAYQPREQAWTFVGPDGPVSVQVRGPLRANNGDVLAAAAVAGLGIVVMPTFIIGDRLREGSLRSLMPGWEPPGIGVHAVYPPGRHLSAKTRVFVDFVASSFNGHTPRDHHQPRGGEG